MFTAGCDYSVLSKDDLIRLLDEHYNIENIKSLHLHRSFIGDVYFVEGNTESYVMKVYKSNFSHKKNAENSSDVMRYLWEEDMNVPKVIKNKNGSNTTTILAPEGAREVVVTSLIDGKSISLENEIHREVGRQAAQIRHTMKDYPYTNRLVKVDEDKLIDNFMEIMTKYFPHKKEEISFFRKYGEELSEKIKELYSKEPNCIGFCHGDFHGGNIIESFDKGLTVFDFDACGVGYAVYDIAVYCDRTDYFNLDNEMIPKMYETLDAFLEGYSTYFNLSRIEKNSIPLFIALRHYELNGTIPNERVFIEGRHWLNDKWVDMQYKWLKKWYEYFI